MCIRVSHTCKARNGMMDVIIHVTVMMLSMENTDVTPSKCSCNFSFKYELGYSKSCLFT